MSDLISREAILKHIEETRQDTQKIDDIREASIIMNSMYLLEEVVSNLQSAQPEIIRCRDCKYYKTMFCKMDIWHKDITLYRADENDYCSYGERRYG